MAGSVSSQAVYGAPFNATGACGVSTKRPAATAAAMRAFASADSARSSMAVALAAPMKVIEVGSAIAVSSLGRLATGAPVICSSTSASIDDS